MEQEAEFWFTLSLSVNLLKLWLLNHFWLLLTNADQCKKTSQKNKQQKKFPQKICLPEKFPWPKNYLPKIIFLILAGKAVLYLQMFPNEFLKCQGWRIEIKYHWSLINYQLSMINYHGSIINDHNDNMSGYYQFNWSCLSSLTSEWITETEAVTIVTCSEH